MKTITRKQITFDLSENRLKLNYPRPKFTVNPRYHTKAWSDIAKFMGKQDFEHRQYSVYTSNKPISDLDVNILIQAMVQRMPWLKKCLNAIDVTEVGEQHSLMYAVENTVLDYKGSLR